MNDEIIHINLEDEIDLHHFHPKDAKYILNEFIDAAFTKEKKQVRIVHGRGQSVLKSIVLKELSRNKKILYYKDDGSNWGATIAVLKDKKIL